MSIEPKDGTSIQPRQSLIAVASLVAAAPAPTLAACGAGSA